MRLLIALFLVVLLSGCGKAQPALSGGKPVSYWTAALRDPDPRLRRKAVFKLGNVGPTDATVFPAVREALRDGDARVRCEAILALLKFGPEAKEAIPDLTGVQQRDPDKKVRSYAAKALEKMRDSAEKSG
jgi:HEAT repeat protein